MKSSVVRMNVSVGVGIKDSSRVPQGGVAILAMNAVRAALRDIYDSAENAGVVITWTLVGEPTIDKEGGAA